MNWLLHQFRCRSVLSLSFLAPRMNGQFTISPRISNDLHSQLSDA